MVDMIFGGKLTSVLVCQKCKHVSQTYEDFNDLSLSIKAEDYVRERKRDRLKTLAKKLASFNPSSSPHLGAGLTTTSHRASSVPPSPASERTDVQLGGDGIPPPADEPRRRSFDVAEQNGMRTDSGSGDGDGEEEDAYVKVVGVASEATTPDDKRVEFGQLPPNEKRERTGKSKESDPWKKIGRRISITMGLGKGSKERKGRPRERGSRDFSSELKVAGPDSTAQSESFAASSVSIARTSISDVTPMILLSRPSSREGHPLEPVDIPKTNSRPHSIQLPRSSSASSVVTSNASLPHLPKIRPAKTSKIPKATPAEVEYLRRILADVAPASASSNPFAMFKSSSGGSSHSNGTSSSSLLSTPQHMWMKTVGQLPGIEECLRMFTAVEVLDGENMVGCRRCWKIENGLYNPPASQDNVDDDEEEDDDFDDDDRHRAHENLIPEEDKVARRTSFPAPNSPYEGVNLPASLSTPSISYYSHSNLSDTASIDSLPTIATSVSDSIIGFKGVPPQLNLVTNTSALESQLEDAMSTLPRKFLIPAISTAPPSPEEETSSPMTARPEGGFTVLERATALDNDTTPQPKSPASLASPLAATLLATRPSTPPGSDTHSLDTRSSVPHVHIVESKDSLLTAPESVKRHRRKSDNETADDSSGGESDGSISTSVHSLESSPFSASHNQVNGVRQTAHSKPKSKLKPVIMRPAYKRYLIATPPPVLVIHLKRFQQIGKSVISFSNGFKKLDDYVAFPEYLDLTPFLAPKREDFGLGRNGREKLKPTKLHKKDTEKCMYRLYAVVVHIGSMVG